MQTNAGSFWWQTWMEPWHTYDAGGCVHGWKQGKWLTTLKDNKWQQIVCNSKDVSLIFSPLHLVNSQACTMFNLVLPLLNTSQPYLHWMVTKCYLLSNMDTFNIQSSLLPGQTQPKHKQKKKADSLMQSSWKIMCFRARWKQLASFAARQKHYIIFCAPFAVTYLKSIYNASGKIYIFIYCTRMYT